MTYTVMAYIVIWHIWLWPTVLGVNKVSSNFDKCDDDDGGSKRKLKWFLRMIEQAYIVMAPYNYRPI